VNFADWLYLSARRITARDIDTAITNLKTAMAKRAAAIGRSK
jgi:hypothetical protein